MKCERACPGESTVETRRRDTGRSRFCSTQHLVSTFIVREIYYSPPSSPTRRPCAILACLRAGHGPGGSPPTPRHARSSSHPPVLACANPPLRPLLFPPNFGQHGAPRATRDHEPPRTRSTRDPAPRPVLHERSSTCPACLLSTHRHRRRGQAKCTEQCMLLRRKPWKGVVRPAGEALHREKGRQ